VAAALINADEVARIEDCWAFYDRSTKFESLGDGNGFKAAGEAGRTPATLPNPVRVTSSPAAFPSATK
jgi:hypothetical protein